MLLPSRRTRFRWLTAGLLILSAISFLARHAPQATERTPGGSDLMAAHPSPAPEPARVNDPSAATDQPPATRFAEATLFAFVSRPEFADSLEAKLPAPAKKVHYVRLNRDWIEGKQSPFWQRPGEGRFLVPLPDGGTLPVVVESSEMLDAERFTSVGHVEGQPASRVLVAYHRGGQLTASIQAAVIPNRDEKAVRNFSVRATGAAEAQFFEIDDSLVPPCGGGREPMMDADALAVLAQRAVAGPQDALADGTAANAPLGADGQPHLTVDLMMLYTPSVLDALTGTTDERTAAVQATVDAAVLEVNTDFARSLIAARVRLVKTARVDYDDSQSSSNAVNQEALYALRRSGDGKLDEVHALRDQVGADLVCLLVGRRDSISSGIGYVLQEPTLADTTLAAGNDLYGFSVVTYATATGSHVVTHELGHNFGCQHDRENASGSEGAYSYSYGYRLTGKNGYTYRTIMAYAPGTRLGYFSNPAIVAPEPGVGVPVGIAAGQPGEACNALTIDRDAFEVAGFRLQRQTAANAGTLINVSTRAFVGTGEQTLIGGFVIGGTQSKKVLVRAIGPALTGFGLAGALADPQLSLVRAGEAQPFATNNDWSLPSAPVTLTDLSVATTASGAFPLAAGSRDAALLITLAPGAYTALMTGANGTTGIGMMEAYETDRTTGAKLVNLSTRGYAEKGREMIAGFVVQGSATETKRVLIRVQGPSLAAYVVNAMYDPCLELRAADGTLLLANDDWSFNAELVNGVRDATKPLAVEYGEKEIARTGLAPKNRREPAALLDLLPGVYSVIVRPFEKAATATSAAQPSQPGVAIVEVFEVNP
ncbi:MAG: hypothetical protein HZA31_01720 [Opitutae bacterium]|nr:hypothetical protein [Opitutae bacterium]